MIIFIYIFILFLNTNFAYSEESLPPAVSSAIDGFSRSLSQNIGTKVCFKNITYNKTSFNNFYYVTCQAFNADEIQLCSLEFYTEGNWIIAAAPGAGSTCADASFSNTLFINLKTGFDESIFWKAEASRVPLKNITLSDDRIIFGSSTAPVKVIIFSDFFCPGCYELSQGIPEIYKKYPKDIVVYFKHHPYSSDNPSYQEIVLFYEQLHSQGLNVYARLFREIRINIEKNGKLDIEALNNTASGWLAGTRKNNFLMRYKNRKQFIKKINTDYEETRSLKLEKTSPACIVNGKLYIGCNAALLEEAISREVHHTPTPTVQCPLPLSFRQPQ